MIRAWSWAAAATIGLGIFATAAHATTAEDSLLVPHAEILRTRRTQISAYPYAYYTPETELAFGAGGIMTFYTAEDAILRPSKVTLSGYYSTKGQYKFSAGPQVYLGKNTIFITAALDYGYYVDKFWGIGTDSPDIDTEEYATRAFGLEAGVQVPPLVRLLHQTQAGVLFDIWNNDVVDKKENPYLTAGGLRGEDGGASTGLGLTWGWDTRDQIFYPTSGGNHQVKAVFYGQWLGGDFDFNRIEVDLRRYIAMSPRQVLAIQAFVQSVFGSPPFYELPALGGQRIMRGYYQGRYRDENLLAGQVEYRTHLSGRFGAVGFAGIGDVSSKLRDLKIRDLKCSFGAGLRVLFNKAEKVNLRADIGFGRGTSGVYFGLEEAF
jgi:outer membrane protein assembly factor BamA